VTEVYSIFPDSLFADTALKVGMVLEIINGKRCASYKESLDMPMKADGHLTFVASRPTPSPSDDNTNKSEKGSLLLDGKFKSPKGRWFGCKKQPTSASVPDATITGSVIKCNSIVVLSVKRDQTVTQERYRVLVIFSKTMACSLGSQ